MRSILSYSFLELLKMPVFNYHGRGNNQRRAEQDNQSHTLETSIIAPEVCVVEVDVDVAVDMVVNPVFEVMLTA
jgi:hypothetical protein